MGPAKLLAHPHQQGVIFLIEPEVGGQMIHEQPAQLLVGAGFRQQPVPAQDPESIGVHHKGGFIQGVEQDAVRGLRADALDLQEPAPQV